jgi:GTPase SAR1 family protein
MPENIHIALLGPISAGKSTLLNALFSCTYSDMCRKKTTMMPQIYQTITNKGDIDSTDKIRKQNKQSNDKILQLRDSNKFTESNFCELIYKVGAIPNFIELPDKSATYSVLDMPGLNCGGNNMYYDYIIKTLIRSIYTY